MSQSLLTIACALALAQPAAPAPQGLPELKPGALVRVTTGRETITGTVGESAAADFLQLQVPGTTGPTYVRRSAVETLRVLPAGEAAAPMAGAAPAGPDANRHLVYVHGICKHGHGFWKPWWDAMKAYTPQGAPGNVHEVVWSDLVNPAMMAATPPGVAPPAAPPAGRTEDQKRLAESLRAILRDRAEQAEGGVAPSGAGPTPAPAAPGHETAAPPGLFGGVSESVECADDFVLYMTDASVRGKILARFDEVVRPLLESGAEVEVISHSWGTVVAYEGLRRLGAGSAAAPAGKVRNLFTVGSALSIWPVRVNLAGRFPGGERPRSVGRWVNIDAWFDFVGGHIQGAPFAVDVERLNLAPVGCSFPVSPVCAHGSYFHPDNVVVNRDVFGRYIGR